MAEQGVRLPYPPCQSGICTTRSCCASDFGGKSEWPEVVGADGQRAKAVIESQNKVVTVVFVGFNGLVLDDFCCNRVYVYLDRHNQVIRTPLLG